MANRIVRRAALYSQWGILIGIPIFFIAACGGGSGGGIQNPGTSPVALGDPIAGLSGAELAAFNHGKTAFAEPEEADDGLGPVFNGTSCGECHSAGAEGGAAPNNTVARVTRIGGTSNGTYVDLPEYGGPVLQARSLLEFDPNYPVGGEVVPIQASYVSHRMTTPLFGAGLLEAVPDQAILLRAQQLQPDGIVGQVNIVSNPETGTTEIGRFGWKAQHGSLHVFAADAYVNEMGITNSIFPTDNLPQGLSIPGLSDNVPDPEDHDGDTEAFTNFMRFLAPPERQIPTPIIAQGEHVFDQIHCSSCHQPTMKTGSNASPALANKTIHPYTDLLLHHMGNGLADGIEQGLATGDQFKTAPLWGLSKRTFFLHDGRATNIEDAVMQHGGEASIARARFANLAPDQKAAILAFLGSL